MGVLICLYIAEGMRNPSPAAIHKPAGRFKGEQQCNSYSMTVEDQWLASRE